MAAPLREYRKLAIDTHRTGSGISDVLQGFEYFAQVEMARSEESTIGLREMNVRYCRFSVQDGGALGSFLDVDVKSINHGRQGRFCNYPDRLHDLVDCIVKDVSFISIDRLNRNGDIRRSRMIADLRQMRANSLQGHHGVAFISASSLQ